MAVLVATVVLAIGSVAAVAVAATFRSGVDPWASGTSTSDGAGGSASVTPGGRSTKPVGGSTSNPTADSPAGLDTELTRALIAIGRSRATAFQRVSARFLAGADVAGSPAYQDDLQLVQRLKARGYRLEGVRYQVSGVEVLHRRGELVDVRALVTTSKHRQIRVNSGATVSVPADGPRSVVLTVAPVEANISGPGRWRVRNVQEAS
jgi:hypothetical protein